MAPTKSIRKTKSSPDGIILNPSKTIEYTRSKSLRNFLRNRFCDKTLFEIFTHGAHVGWPGLTTNRDLMYLYKKYSKELWHVILNERVAGAKFLCLVGQLKEYNQLAERVVWICAEHYAYEFAHDWAEKGLNK